jgi:hypothetical protein
VASVSWIENFLSTKFGEANSVQGSESLFVLLGFLMLNFIVDISKVVVVSLEESESFIGVGASPVGTSRDMVLENRPVSNVIKDEVNHITSFFSKIAIWEFLDTHLW